MKKSNKFFAKLKHEGVLGAAVIFSRRVAQKILRQELVFTLQDAKNLSPIKDDLHFEIFSSSSECSGVADLFDSSGFERAKERLNNGEFLVCLFQNESIASYGWGREQSSLYFSFVLNGMDLKKKVFYIYDCYTYPNFRGKGFYSYVLVKLCEIAGDLEVFVACRSHNVGSVKGILRAGFELYKKFVLLDLYFFKLRFIFTPKDGML